MTALIKYDAMCVAIDVCHRVDEAKEIRNQAAMLKEYARQAGNHDAERKLAAIRVRAERKAGELSAALEKRPAWPATPPMLRAVGSCTTPRNGGPVLTGQRSVGAIRGTSEAGGWNMLSFMPIGRKIFSRAYWESIFPLRRCTSSPSRMKLMSLYT